MQYLVTAKEAKKIDTVSIETMEIPSLVLMERAALKTAEYICKKLPAASRIAAIAGGGNNGGDAVATGRILSEWGYSVTVFLAGSPERLSAECGRQLQIAKNLKIDVREADKSIYPLNDYDGIIDGLFGIGLSRAINGNYSEWIKEINRQEDAKVFSVDIPSGVDADTGKIWGDAVCADATVTFGFCKRGLFLFPGTACSGDIEVADIGFPGQAEKLVQPNCFTYQKEDIKRLFPKRKMRSNKGSYGRTLVIAGSENISGAALFAAAAAYRMGSGLVEVVSHVNNRTMIQTKLPEALSLYYQTDKDKKPFFGKKGNPVPDGVSEIVPEKYPAPDEDNHLPSDNSQKGSRQNENQEKSFKQRLKQEIERASVIVAGPGIGTELCGNEIMDVLLSVRDKTVVLDADALNILAGRREWFNESGEILLPANFILTPHLKEMSRMQKCTVEAVAENLPAFAAKSRKGMILVLKDARTLVSDGNQLYINRSGNSALAKGGSGDVLSGMIGGLIAQGTDAFTAASLAVYLHGLAAEEYVKEKSVSSMLATDLLQILPAILK